VQRLIVHRRLKRPTGPRYVFILLAAFSTLGMFSALSCASVLLGGAGTVYAYNRIKEDLPDPASLASRPVPQVTRIYDRTGQHLLYEFYEERRIAVPLAEVSPHMIQATLAIEDANFYRHPGFDIVGISRAAIKNLQRGGIVGGGSTITQQLVKQVFLSDEQSFIRKLREVILATQVEVVYSKDHILEMYLNHVYYGNQAYGVEAAALSYFGKHAKDLTLAESAILAGLVQRPSAYDPVRNRNAAGQRQRQVLEQMERLGMVTEEDATAASEEAAGFTYRMQESRIEHPHFSFFVKDQLQQRINPDLLRQGLEVISTLDVDVNTTAQEIIKRRVDSIRWQQVNNGSLVAINPKTGEILAMVGSYDYYNTEIDGQVNVSTALRQPGSSFKAYTYATALATKRLFTSTLIADVPLSRVDTTSKTGLYRPVNYDGRYHGNVSIRSALANSYNIPALLAQDAVGTAEVIKTARSMGITTELPPVASLTLGAGVVRLLDMTSAYGVFAAGGTRVEPTPFLRISDRNGNVIHQLGDPRGTQVVSPEVSYIISDILSDRLARRPMFGNVLDLAANRTAAVKTGTTNDYKDSWTVGYTPSLVAGVWVGNTDNSAMLQVAGSLGAGYIWKDFVEAVLEGKPDEPFTMPPGVVRAPICRGQSTTDLFIQGTVPTACPPVLVPGPEWRATPFHATQVARGIDPFRSQPTPQPRR
jgi:1A family penicillin-binding protein